MISTRHTKQLHCLSAAFNGLRVVVPRNLQRVLAIVVVATIVLLPRTSYAEFISATAQSAETGLLTSALIEVDSASLDVCWGLFGWTSGSDQRDPAPVEKTPAEENHRPLDAFGVCDLGNSTGMGTSSPPSGGATSGSIGILNGSLAPWLPVCSGTMLCGNVLVPPAPPPSGLLDPPKDVACMLACLSCR